MAGYLVRKLRVGDELAIGGDIRVRVQSCSQGFARLLIVAPRHVPVQHVEGVVLQLQDYMTSRKAG